MSNRDHVVLTSRPAWTLRCAMFGIVIFLIWASLGKVDQVTHVQAQVIANAKNQVVQSADAGVITKIHIHEGDSVRSGQLLVTLEHERAQAAVNDSKAKIAALEITLSRLRAELYETPLNFSSDLLMYTDYIRNQTNLYKKRKQAISEDINSLNTMLAISTEELKMNQQLEVTGDVGKTEILRLQRTIADVQAQITNKRNKYFQDAQIEMTKAQEELSTQTEQLRDRNQSLEHTQLLSPNDGIIKNIKVTTIGAVIRPGDVVLEIFPTNGNLLIEAKIPPSDIGFIKVGQLAAIKLDAYDYSIFGTLKGKITYISADTIGEETSKGTQFYYKIYIEIQNKEFNGNKSNLIVIRPGMTAGVDIKAGDRSVLNYLVKPIFKTFSQSFGER